MSLGKGSGIKFYKQDLSDPIISSLMLILMSGLVKYHIRKPYSPTKSLVSPTILVMVRCRVRVCGSGLGFWNLVGETRDLVGE